ncbi:MAG: hypothetical protein ACTSO9_08115 [Candidatus Helarchaeota archaeon]
MVVDKLSWFRKGLSGIGKRIFFWKTNKANLFLVNGTMRCVIRLYAKLNDNNFEKALDLITSQIEEESKNLISEMLNKPLLAGISMDGIISRDMDDLPFLASAVFWSIMGKDSKKIFADPKFIKEPDGSYKMIIKQNMCILCAEEKELKAEDLGSQNFGDIFALLFRGVIQAFVDYVGNEYDVTARETKCFMRGDPHGEITVTLTPRK